MFLSVPNIKYFYLKRLLSFYSNFPSDIIFLASNSIEVITSILGIWLRGKVKAKVVQLCPTLCEPHRLVHGILQARILEWVAFLFSRGSSQPRDQTQVSHIADGFFTSWATGKSKSTRVSSLSLLQEIFPTQESNWYFLRCRWILYQLSYQGSPLAKGKLS